MPQISEFCGIAVYMYYRDHQPPHFHVEYGGQWATISIDGQKLIRGVIPRRASRMVRKWAAEQESALREDGELARQRKPLKRIKPLP